MTTHRQADIQTLTTYTISSTAEQKRLEFCEILEMAGFTTINNQLNFLGDLQHAILQNIKQPWGATLALVWYCQYWVVQRDSNSKLSGKG